MIALDENDRLRNGTLPHDPFAGTAPFLVDQQARIERVTIPPRLLTLDDMLDQSLDRAEQRSKREEKPIPLPWPSLESHFGGGLWPGVHFLCAGTGIGKTALSLQVALHAARASFPVAYVGLELEALQVTLRMLGEQARVPWSMLYTGQAGPSYLEAARQAAPQLRGLPLHFEFGRPRGWPVSELGSVAEAMRAKYPEESGPGSRPFLLVLDFLQIVGDEVREGRPAELRERIGRAAYFSRDVAARLDAAVFVIASVARDKYALLADAIGRAGLTYVVDDRGRPVKRGLLAPDVLVGLGKESGEIEFSADSVSTVFRVPGTWSEAGCDVVFATAKGRATGPTWSPLRFTGFRYEETPDGGAETVRAFEEVKKKRQRAKAERDQGKADKALADAVAVARFVQENPRCSVRSARLVVDDNPRRWAVAKEILGAALVGASGKPGAKTPLTFDPSKATTTVRAALEPRDEDPDGEGISS